MRKTVIIISCILQLLFLSAHRHAWIQSVSPVHESSSLNKVGCILMVVWAAIYTCTHTHTHACIHTHAHTCTRTHTQAHQAHTDLMDKSIFKKPRQPSFKIHLFKCSFNSTQIPYKGKLRWIPNSKTLMNRLWWTGWHCTHKDFIKVYIYGILIH